MQTPINSNPISQLIQAAPDVSTHGAASKSPDGSDTQALNALAGGFSAVLNQASRPASDASATGTGAAADAEAVSTEALDAALAALPVEIAPTAPTVSPMQELPLALQNLPPLDGESIGALPSGVATDAQALTTAGYESSIAAFGEHGQPQGSRDGLSVTEVSVTADAVGIAPDATHLTEANGATSGLLTASAPALSQQPVSVTPANVAGTTELLPVPAEAGAGETSDETTALELDTPMQRSESIRNVAVDPAASVAGTVTTSATATETDTVQAQQPTGGAPALDPTTQGSAQPTAAAIASPESDAVRANAEAATRASAASSKADARALAPAPVGTDAAAASATQAETGSPGMGADPRRMDAAQPDGGPSVRADTPLAAAVPGQSGPGNTTGANPASVHLAAAGGAPAAAPNTLGGADAAAATSNTPQQFQLHPDLHSVRWNGALGERLVMLARNGDQSAELILNPPNLGRLSVQLSIDNDNASVQFMTSHTAVRDALEAALPKLRELMAEGGLRLADVDVSQQDANAQQFGGQRDTDDRERTTAHGAGTHGGDADVPRADPVGISLVDAYV